MKHVLAAALILFPAAGMAQDCRWAGGSYRGQEGPFQARIQVNADCTELTMQSSGNDGIQPEDEPQTFALSDEGSGWVADVNGVKATLAKDGDFVTFFGEGLDTRMEMNSIE
jgi:hypothetical protein